MVINELNSRQDSFADEYLIKVYSQFQALLIELKKRDLPANITSLVNDAVDQINSSALTGKQLAKFTKQQQTIILKTVEKQLKVVPKKHYRMTWMLFGFTAFGLPIGALIGLSLGNIGLLGSGLPIGMGIGLIVGSMMDKKALKEGRQLDIEIKH